ncbi:MAG: hypothetical protein ACJ76L_05135 [Conexibacter sp.]
MGAKRREPQALTAVPLDATTVRLLPEHVDLSIVLTTAGLGAFVASCIGALLRFGAERLRRVALLGSMLGGTLGVVYWLLLLTGAIP